MPSILLMGVALVMPAPAKEDEDYTVLTVCITAKIVLTTVQY